MSKRSAEEEVHPDEQPPIKLARMDEDKEDEEDEQSTQPVSPLFATWVLFIGLTMDENSESPITAFNMASTADAQKLLALFDEKDQHVCSLNDHPLWSMLTAIAAAFQTSDEAERRAILDNVPGLSPDWDLGTWEFRPRDPILECLHPLQQIPFKNGDRQVARVYVYSAHL